MNTAINKAHTKDINGKKTAERNDDGEGDFIEVVNKKRASNKKNNKLATKG